MTTTLSVRRLAWAGVEIRLGDTRLLIDPLENVAPLAPVMGPPHRPVDPVDTPPGTHALITHLHPDHYDHDLIARIAATGTIGCHTPSAAALHEAGITPVAQDLGQSRRIGKLTVTPVTSLDWRGNDCDQVAWVVEGPAGGSSTAATPSGTAAGGRSPATTARSTSRSSRSTASSPTSRATRPTSRRP